MSKPKKMPFSIHEGVLLQAALRRNLSIAESLTLPSSIAIGICAMDGCNQRWCRFRPPGRTTVTLLNPSDWQQRTERNSAHADSVARRALLDLAVPSAGNDVVVALKGQGQ